MMRDRIVDEIVAPRQEAGMSLRELARRSGVSVGGLCEIETGKHSPTLTTLRALAGVFDVGIELVDE